MGEAHEVTDERGGRSLALVHLSDVHFGPHHLFGPQMTPLGDRPSDDGPLPLATVIRADLESWAPPGPAVTCITGDLTETASADEFEAARRFVAELGQVRVNDAPAPVVLVPGNHDVRWDQAEPHERMRPWCAFLTSVRKEFVDPETEALRAHVITEHAETHGVVIAALNSSAWVEKGTPGSERGHIKRDDLGRLQRDLEEVDPDVMARSVKIALVHHHPVLLPDLADPGRSYDAIENSGHLLRVLRKFGFHLALHGHKHLPFTFLEASRPAQGATTRPLLIVGGGTVSAVPSDRLRPPENTYNRIMVKHLPDSGETRISVETRRLVRTDDAGDPLLDGDWRWATLRVDDRVFGRTDVAVTSHPVEDRPFSEERDDDSPRLAQYQAARNFLPVISVRPSLLPGQAYEAELRLVFHERPGVERPLPPTRVVWSAGPRHHVITVDRPPYAAVLPYYGPMLVQMDAYFPRGHHARSFIYAQDSRVVVADPTTNPP